MAKPSVFIQCIDRTVCTNKTESTKITSYKAWIWILTFASYLCYHMCRKPISVVHSVLHSNNCTALNDSNPDCWPPFDADNYSYLFSDVDATWLWSYAIGMFISGYIADRVDLRLYLGTGMILSAASCAMFGFGFYFGSKGIGLWYYILAMVFSGFTQSTGWPSVVATLGNWFGKGNRGLIMGIWNCHTSFGNIAGTTLAGVFLPNWGLSFIVPGIIMACIGVIVLLFMVPEPAAVNLPNPNKPEEPAVSIIEPSPEEKDKAISIFSALKIPGVVEFSLCLFFAKLVAYTFLFWLPIYINQNTDFDAADSAYLSTMFDVGGIAGGIAAGVLSDRTGLPAVTCATFLTLSIPTMACYLAFADTSLGLNIFLLLLMGFVVNGPYSLITTAVSAELGTHESLKGNAKALATVTALIDGTGSIGAAVGPQIAGPLSTYNWDYIFYMLIVSAIIALLLLSRLVYHEAQTIKQRFRQRALSTS